MHRANTQYIIKEFPTYRVGQLIVDQGNVSKKILRNNRDCFNADNCWPGTVAQKINLGNGQTKLKICLHNITHADKPAHLYADHLINFYEKKMHLINNKKLALTVVRAGNLDKKITANDNANRALFIIKNKINAGLQLLTNQAITDIARLKFKVLMTNCLSVDPLDFPANSKKTNHYRLMERGIIIIERAPLSATQSDAIKIVRAYESSPQDDAEIVNILPVN